jgi:hypothetical protein
MPLAIVALVGLDRITLKLSSASMLVSPTTVSGPPSPSRRAEMSACHALRCNRCRLSRSRPRLRSRRPRSTCSWTTASRAQTGSSYRRSPPQRTRHRRRSPPFLRRDSRLLTHVKPRARYAALCAARHLPPTWMQTVRPPIRSETPLTHRAAAAGVTFALVPVATSADAAGPKGKRQTSEQSHEPTASFLRYPFRYQARALGSPPARDSAAPAADRNAKAG